MMPQPNDFDQFDFEDPWMSLEISADPSTSSQPIPEIGVITYILLNLAVGTNHKPLLVGVIACHDECIHSHFLLNSQQ